MIINRRQGLAALATACTPAVWPASALAQTGAAPAALPLQTFFRHDQLSLARLNPAGTRVALCHRGDTGRRRLAVLDLATMKTSVVASFEKEDVVHCHWVNDERLLLRVADEDEDERWPGLFAVDADGGRFKRLDHPFSRLVAQGPQQGDHVLLMQAQDSSEGWGFLKLMRVNTRSAAEEVLDVPPWSVGFLIDTQGEPVAAVTARGTTARLMWRHGKDWRVLREFDRFLGGDLVLEGIDAEGQAYVTARRKQDRAALYRYDPKADVLSEQPLLALNEFDVNPTLVFSQGRLLGAMVEADARTTVWFDAAAKALQARIDARLPDTGNLLSLPTRGNSPWVLVWAYSDRQPGTAMLFNRETDKLAVIGRARPQVEPARMSTMDYTPYVARDGRRIPAYLTLPASAGATRPLPLVLLVHGGPFTRGQSWRFNDEVQFLASRGYAVLQPEFRGSTGFGDAHFKAGWRQWGQAMQDDLADGARWAIAQGIADPARIAIAGASYGGYAAMMGLARHPELFACAINWVGVTELDLLFSRSWSDLSAVYREHGLPRIVGDRVADAAMLKAHSPVHLAAQIRKPVLMAYGRLDQRVPSEHGERMRDALKRHNTQVEWVLYDDEGHGWFREKTNIDFWTRVERFLSQHLAENPSGAPAPAPS